MRMPWFRMYSEARTDRKLDLLTDEEFRIWFNLLCMASESEIERGTLLYDDLEELAIEVSRGDTDKLSHALSRLVTLKMCDVTRDTITFCNFEKRQQRKPSDLPERTRDRKRKSRLMSHDVTPLSRPVTRVTPLEEIREEEDKKEKEKHSTSAKRKSTPTRPTRIEEDWIPSTYQLTYAKDQGMTDAQIRKTADNFRDYWLSTGKAMVSWDATWRRWVRTDLEKPTNGSHTKNGKPDFWKLAQEMRKEEAERGTR
jgi:hypothetical protein